MSDSRNDRVIQINAIIAEIGNSGRRCFQWDSRCAFFSCMGRHLYYHSPFNSHKNIVKITEYRSTQGDFIYEGDYVHDAVTGGYRLAFNSGYAIEANSMHWKSKNLMFLCLDFTDFIITGRPTNYLHSRECNWDGFWHGYSINELESVRKKTIDIGFYQQGNFTNKHIRILEADGIGPGLFTPFFGWDY